MTKSNSSRSETTINDTMDNYLQSFFITIRKHQVKDYVDVQDIMNIIGYLISRLPTLRVGSNSFETDKRYKQLHFHGIITVNEYFRYKYLTSYSGFRIYWKPIYSHKGLISYITKDTPNKYK